MNQRYEDNGKGFTEELVSDDSEITLNLFIPFDESEVDLERELSGEEKEAADAVPTPFPPFNAFSYFKVKDKKGNLITAFNPPLVLTIEYGSTAWYKTQREDFWIDRPRVFYLGKYGTTWAGRWDEFPAEAIAATAPDGDSPGILQISITNIPDPRIGGC